MDYLQKTLCLHQERNTFGLQYIVNYLWIQSWSQKFWLQPR
jgi:hypothetical protein